MGELGLNRKWLLMSPLHTLLLRAHPVEGAELVSEQFTPL